MLTFFLLASPEDMFIDFKSEGKGERQREKYPLVASPIGRLGIKSAPGHVPDGSELLPFGAQDSAPVNRATPPGRKR